MKKDYLFGAKSFKKWADNRCDLWSKNNNNANSKTTTYNLTPIPSNGYLELFTGILDHGFIADCACVWDKRLEGHEFAIISRTYCGYDDIDNQPEGLNIVRLPKSVMGKKDGGTAISTVIIGKSESANIILTACAQVLPGYLLPYVMSCNMNENRYSIHLHPDGTVYTKAEILEVWE